MFFGHLKQVEVKSGQFHRLQRRLHISECENEPVLLAINLSNSIQMNFLIKKFLITWK